MGNVYLHSPYRYDNKHSNLTTVLTETPSSHQFGSDKATVLPKRQMHMTQHAQQPINRGSPSRNSPAVARRITTTAQSVLGGVKNLLMPATLSSSINNNNSGDRPNSAQYMSNHHHPYFNNHSPSRLQRQNYHYTHIQKGTTSGNLTVGSITTTPSTSSPQRLQPPGTPVRQSSPPNQQSGGSGRATSALLTSLDKSILQIRDWLTLLEDVQKKDKVDLSDVGHICRMLERQRVSFYNRLLCEIVYL